MNSVDPSPIYKLRSGMERLLKEKKNEASRDDDEKLLELQCLLSAAGHYLTTSLVMISPLN